MFGLIAGGISAIAGAFQAIQGAKMARDARHELDKLQIPDLRNVAEGLQVSTLGNNLISDQNAVRFASNVDALRSGGMETILGGLGTANEIAKQTDLQIKADYDKQENDIAMAQAEDEARIRAMKEARYQQDVAALSSQVNAGQQMKWQGIHGIAQGVVSGAQMESQEKFNKDYLSALTKR